MCKTCHPMQMSQQHTRSYSDDSIRWTIDTTEPVDKYVDLIENIFYEVITKEENVDPSLDLVYLHKIRNRLAWYTPTNIEDDFRDYLRMMFRNDYMSEFQRKCNIFYLVAVPQITECPKHVTRIPIMKCLLDCILYDVKDRQTYLASVWYAFYEKLMLADMYKRFNERND